MSKNVLIAVGVMLLLLAAGGWYYFSTGKGPQSVQQVVQQVAQQATKKSLKDLVLAGLPVSCTIKSGTGEGATSGTTYVSGKKVRADFTSADSSGKEIAGHMIQDGTYAYIWTEGESKGTKMKIEAEEDAKTQTGSTPTTQSGGVDTDEQMDMNCNPWLVNEAMFVPPTNVQFTDFSQMLKDVQNLQTTACDGISDPEAKAACLSAMGGGQ